MLIKPIILRSKNCLLEPLRRRTDLDDLAAFLTKFPDQEPVGAVYPQGNFRTIIGQRFKRWQRGNRNQRCKAGQQNTKQSQRKKSGKRVNPPAR